MNVAGREHDGMAGPGTVDRLTIMARDIGDILRRLEPALDLETGDPQFDQPRNQVEGGEVLGAEQVLDVVQIDKLAVANDLVRHAARLGAFASIGRPATERLAGETLPRISHAESAMNEHFEGKIDRLADPADLGEIQLARRMTRVQPSSRARATPAALVIDICVDA